MHRAHTRAYMHTFDGIRPKYTLEAVGVNNTLEAIGTLRTHLHAQKCIRIELMNSQAIIYGYSGLSDKQLM